MTVGWPKPSARAARRKLPAWATARKTRRSSHCTPASLATSRDETRFESGAGRSRVEDSPCARRRGALRLEGLPEGGTHDARQRVHAPVHRPRAPPGGASPRVALLDAVEGGAGLGP